MSDYERPFADLNVAEQRNDHEIEQYEGIDIGDAKKVTSRRNIEKISPPVGIERLEDRSERNRTARRA